MSTPKYPSNAMKELDDTLAKLNDQRKKLDVEWCAKHAKFAIGQSVNFPFGRNQTRKGTVVKHIAPTEWSGLGYRVQHQKKDGTPGAFVNIKHDTQKITAIDEDDEL